MTVFDLQFALTTLILGLALTNIAGSLHRLALAGRRVRWAPEPVLLVLLVVMIIVSVWLDQWNMRALTELYFGVAMLAIVRFMTIYFAAASCLPEVDLVGSDGIDLKDYYYRTRALTYGAMIAGLLLFSLARVFGGQPITLVFVAGNLAGPTLYALLIWSRRRWVHIAVLLFVLAAWGGPTMMASIKA